MAPGTFDPALAGAAQRLQQLREASDYDARDVPDEEARAGIGLAERFVAAVAGMLER